MVQFNRFVFGVIFITSVATGPATAESMFPISVPGECVELAQREGAPLVIYSKYEAVKAKLKLARLSSRDPLVVQCRAAVERGRIAMKGVQFPQMVTSGVTP